MLYIYLNFIKYDIDDLNRWSIPFAKLILFIHDVCVWITSVIFFPLFLIGMIVDKEDKKMRKKLGKSPLKNKNIYNYEN